MSINRELKTYLENVLELIHVAHDYGWYRPILLEAFADIMGGVLTDEEIEWYAKGVENTDGYSHDDYVEAKIVLNDFKKQYINQ